MDFEEIEALVLKLQNRAYRHGATDQENYLSNRKYDEAMNKSDHAREELVEAIQLYVSFMMVNNLRKHGINILNETTNTERATTNI